MQYHRSMRYIIASVSLILGLLLVAVGIGQAADQPAPTVKKVPVHVTTSMKGQDLFREYCAVCHGPGGKGNGPAASALKIPPSDLTQIAARNGGKFPAVKVQNIITGDAEDVAAHGSKEMPMWGDIFRHMGGHTEDIGFVRVHNLEKYIEGLQAK